MHVLLEVDGEVHELWLTRTEDRVGVEAEDTTYDATLLRAGRAFEVRVGGKVRRVEVLGPTGARIDGKRVAFRVAGFEPGGAPGKHGAEQTGAARVRPPMPGRVLALRVREGDGVRKGQVLLVLEAMKMQNEVVAPTAGRVARVRVREGDVVEASSVLVELEAA